MLNTVRTASQDLCRRFTGGAQFTEKVRADGKVAIVTGANAGLGVETTRGLNERGAKVYMLCRSLARGETARQKLIEEGCDGARLILVQCDMCSFDSIRKCAATLAEEEEHIDILVNNAAVMNLPKYELTEDGHETTWQSNHLGPFLLTELLLPLLMKSEAARIVNVSAALHVFASPLKLDRIDSEQSFGGMTPYQNSKLANIMHCRELTRRLRASGCTTVTANSLHPGVFVTELTRHYGSLQNPLLKRMYSLVASSAKDGAATSLYLALSTELQGVSGQYFQDCARWEESEAARDDVAAQQLYDYSLQATQQKSEREVLTSL